MLSFHAFVHYLENIYKYINVCFKFYKILTFIRLKCAKYSTQFKAFPHNNLKRNAPKHNTEFRN